MIPNNLNEGSDIGVCTLSSLLKGKDNSEILKTKEELEKLNINTILGSNLFLNDSSKVNADDFNNMIVDNNIDGIIFAKGGTTSYKLLDKIDYEAIKNNPKIIIGFSDNTSVLNAIYTNTRTCYISFFKL